MYHVISTGIAATILYLTSWALCSFGFYPHATHRKLWNILMAVAFLATAAAGLFLALQITYKWNIPIIKTVLKWHVEAGIGFSFSAFFHAAWHLRYYFTPLPGGISEGALTGADSGLSRGNLNANLFLLGYASSSSQLLLLREIMNIAGGYELIAGVFLASWLILSGAGSLAASRSAIADARKLNMAFIAAFLLSAFLLPLVTRLFLNRGESPSFLSGMMIILIVILPVCFISGFSFMRLVILNSSEKNRTPGKLFSAETAGGIAAGLLIPILSTIFTDNWQMILVVILLFAGYTLSVSGFNTRLTIIASALLVSGTIIVFITEPGIFFRGLLLPAVRITGTTDTPYGNITTGEYGGESTVYYNHHILKWDFNEADSEENVHYAMVQREKPEHVLLISGNADGELREIMKYPVKSITMVERDPVLMGMQSAGIAGTDQAGIKLVGEDAFRFIREPGELYDMIIAIIPPPSTLSLNRYFTLEFFRSLKERLMPGGVYICSPGPGETYFNNESLILYSSVYNSLSDVFVNVLPIVGNKLYFVASDYELSHEIARLSEMRGIETNYVNGNYLSDDIIKMKTDNLLSLLDRNEKRNTLRVPVACFHYQKLALSRNQPETIPAVMFILLLLLIPAVNGIRRNPVMFTAAGALAGFEIVLLVVLQSTAGNMYQLTGIIVAGVMTGLALGAMSGRKIIYINNIKMILLFSFLFYTAAGIFTGNMLAIKARSGIIFMLIALSLVPSYLTGKLFAILTSGSNGSLSAPSVYSSDLAGSALVIMAVSAVTIPLAGIQASVFLLSFVIFCGFLFATIANK